VELGMWNWTWTIRSYSSLWMVYLQIIKILALRLAMKSLLQMKLLELYTMTVYLG